MREPWRPKVMDECNKVAIFDFFKNIYWHCLIIIFDHNNCHSKYCGIQVHSAVSSTFQTAYLAMQPLGLLEKEIQ